VPPAGRADSGAAQAPGAGELEARLRAGLGVGVAVRVLPPGTVPRSEVGKAVRVTRWRDGAPPLPGLD
jgi:phenylacetate-CoA ligase